MVIRPTEGDVLLMVGTTKGAFLFHASPKRKEWNRSGPFFPGHAVYAMAYDGRNGRRRLWASETSMHWGAVLRSSDDFGKTWTDPVEANVKFPADTGAALAQIWQITVGRGSDPDRMFAGVEPAALFESRDAGATWSLVRSLWDHPHRARWEPGGGGLGLHTVLPHPEDGRRMLVAISTGGVYRTDDGGATWNPSTRGVRADFLPDKYPEFGQCVHKVARAGSRPDLLFLQNHGGLYRSEDDGRTWREIANGVPSDFGFPIAAHPRDAFTAWVIPLHSDQFRCTPDGKLRVYKTKDGGLSWTPRSQGLPQKDALETILRDALCTDALDPCGVYFGTRSGKLWGSRDEGRSWDLVTDGLPPVVCVKTAIFGRPLGGAVKTTVRRKLKRKKKKTGRKKKTAKKKK